MRRRGRPRDDENPERVEQHATIVRALDQLTAWGFAWEMVCEQVGLTAKEVLGRVCPDRLALSAGRIRQIYAAARGRRGWQFPRKRFTKRSLQERCPKSDAEMRTWGTRTWSNEDRVRELARVLLANGGRWPREKEEDEVNFVTNGDLELTPRAAAGGER